MFEDDLEENETVRALRLMVEQAKADGRLGRGIRVKVSPTAWDILKSEAKKGSMAGRENELIGAEVVIMSNDAEMSL